MHDLIIGIGLLSNDLVGVNIGIGSGLGEGVSKRQMIKSLLYPAIFAQQNISMNQDILPGLGYE